MNCVTCNKKLFGNFNTFFVKYEKKSFCSAICQYKDTEKQKDFIRDV